MITPVQIRKIDAGTQPFELVKTVQLAGGVLEVEGTGAFIEDGVLTTPITAGTDTYQSPSNYAIATAELSGSVMTLDTSSAPVFEVDLTEDIDNVVVANIPSGWYSTIYLYIQSNGFTITWPNNFLFQDGDPPVLSSGTDIVSIVSLPDSTYAVFYKLNFQAVPSRGTRPQRSPKKPKPAPLAVTPTRFDADEPVVPGSVLTQDFTSDGLTYLKQANSNIFESAPGEVEVLAINENVRVRGFYYGGVAVAPIGGTVTLDASAATVFFLDHDSDATIEVINGPNRVQTLQVIRTRDASGTDRLLDFDGSTTAYYNAPLVLTQEDNAVDVLTLSSIGPSSANIFFVTTALDLKPS